MTGSIISWTAEQFGTNVSAPDDEHKTIFAMLNKLHDTVAAGDQAGGASQLDELIAFVAKHFKTEEDLMQQNNYPNYAAHKAAHDKLVDTCLGLQKKVHAGEATLSADVTMMVRDWLTNHIPNVDKPYGPFLNERGIR